MIRAEDLIGTWQFARPEEGSDKDFLHFTYTRALDFIYEGEVRQILQLWYVLEEPNLIRFRTHPQDEGWTCTLDLKGEHLVITCDAQRTECTRAHPEDIPDWFQHEVAERLAKAM
jgi:hypothetical protein